MDKAGLQTVIDLFDGAVIATDLSGKVSLWSKGAETLYGWTRDEAVGRDILELTPSEMSQEQAGAIMADLGAGRSWVGSFPVRRKGGERFVAHVTDVPMHDAAGQLAGILGISREVKPDLPPEAVLRLLADAVDSATEGVVVADVRLADHPVVEVSSGFERLSGYSREEILGRNCRFLQGPDTDPATVEDMRRAIAAGESVSCEVLNYRKDGSPFWNFLRLSPMPGPTGGPGLYVGVQTDITEQRTARERQNEVERALLASEMKQQFLGVMGHELRTPLTAVFGALRLLQASDLDPSQQGYVRVLERGSRRLIDLVDKILTMVAVTEGEQVKTTPASVRELVQAAMSTHARQAQDAGLELSVNVDPAVPEQFTTSPAYLQQIVEELVANAIANTDSGAVRLDVTFDAGIAIAVTDSGRGIATKHLDAIFEDFHQVDSSDQREVQGAGLGLALCRRLARALGGDVQVVSEIGRGSCFTLRLPEASATEPALARASGDDS